MSACLQWQVRLAVHAVRRGGVVAYPTEGVFGLGCDPRRETAVRRILELKRRPVKKGLILIAADFSQVQPYLLPVTGEIRARLETTWPGPITWLLPARPEVPRWLKGRHDTLAVRVTAHPLAADFCRALGFAIVSTSANHAARPPARMAWEVRRAFGAGIDYILPGAVGGRTGPSEIRDGMTGRRLR